MPAASDSAHATTATAATTASRTAPSPEKPPSTSYRDSTLGVFALLLAFRIVNALTLRTFFQPDEFFQSLEPAWQLAFGRTSNAWITWVIPDNSRIGFAALRLTLSRSGLRNCARPCTQSYLQPPTESRLS